MNPSAALTIQLRPDSPNRYVMDMHLDIPARQINTQQLPAGGVAISIPWFELLATTQDPVAYGRHLSTALFGEATARTALAVARAQADADHLSLHVGLDVTACAPEIHALRWETLQDSDLGQVGWGFSERILFSRRLATSDIQPVKPRSRPAQSAVVAIAAPSDLSRYGFNSIPVVAEMDHAYSALRHLHLTTVVQIQGTFCTLQNLLTALRSGPDILCLVAHGRSINGEMHLWLENDQGQSAPIASSDLTARLTALEPMTRPALIVFAICESGAADAAGEPLRAIGPMLASNGIAATLAMHGLLSFDTNAVFLPAVLSEVLRDGVIDRAVAAARGAVSTHADWWVPVLWLRLPHGRLWQPSVSGHRIFGDASRTPIFPQKGASMNTARGFATLKAHLTMIGSEELASVNALEAKLIDLRKKERLFGNTPQRSSEFAEIMYGLNAIALEQCRMSFNDLCDGATIS